MTIEIKPLYDRVVVERLKAKETIGSIIIPDAAQERAQEAVVLAIGPGKFLEDGDWRPVTVNVGDHVLLGKYGGSEVEIDGRKVLIVREEEILAVRTGKRLSAAEAI